MKFLLLFETKPRLRLVLKYHRVNISTNEIVLHEWRLAEGNIEKLKAEDIDFAFEQAEKQLDGTVKEADVILSRTSILLTITLGFIASFVGFSISQLESQQTNYTLVLTAISGIVYLAIPAFQLVKKLKGHRYGTIGSEPVLLLDEYYVITYPEIEKRDIMVRLKEIKEYQKRINWNKATNKSRWAIFDYSLRGMIYFPFLLAFSYFVLKMISKLL